MPTFMAVHPIKPHMQPGEAAQLVLSLFQHLQPGHFWQRYWLCDDQGRMFCLWDAPNVEGLAAILRASGIPTDGVYEVVEGDPVLLQQGLDQ